jgi:hypothetical protein
MRAAKTTSELNGSTVAARKEASSKPQYPYSDNPSSMISGVLLYKNQ